ncbi:MAG TPA: monovalent cation/H(+) antiporter subunit G [Actinomycetota bacterium]|jgi:multicomponent Na+:H+ antiporter subunit G|nr:monovalent cation/H(+) antiporter subunit G [Actinomycetota bacterium]
MTPRAITAIALLVLGVGTELACCLGVLVMRGVYDKLHYTASATSLGALAIAGAVLLRESTVHYGIKAILIALALLITNPVLTHAIARAARIRRHGAWSLQEEEDEVVEKP